MWLLFTMRCIGCGQWIPIAGDICPYCRGDTSESRRLYNLWIYVRGIVMASFLFSFVVFDGLGSWLLGILLSIVGVALVVTSMRPPAPPKGPRGAIAAEGDGPKGGGGSPPSERRDSSSQA